MLMLDSELELLSVSLISIEPWGHVISPRICPQGILKKVFKHMTKLETLLETLMTVRNTVLIIGFSYLLSE